MNIIAHPLPKVSGQLIAIDSDNLDAGNTQAFKDAIQPYLDSCSLIVIDMSALRFVDSSGLGAMLACLRAMNNKHGQLKLIGLNSTVRSLFELVRMHRIFSIHGSCEEALASL